MSAILAVLLPVFLLVALASPPCAAVRCHVTESGALGSFVANFALPAVLFRTLLQRPPGEAADFGYLLAYGSGSLLVFGLAVAAARRLGGKPLAAASLFGMGMAFSNSVFIGLPVVLQALGPEAGVAVALTVLIETLLMFPLILMLAEGGRAADAGRPACGPAHRPAAHRHHAHRAGHRARRRLRHGGRDAARHSRRAPWNCSPRRPRRWPCS